MVSLKSVIKVVDWSFSHVLAQLKNNPLPSSLPQQMGGLRRFAYELSLLNFSTRLPHVLSVDFHQSEQSKRQDPSKVEVRCFYSLISEVTSHLSCHFLFISIKTTYPSPYVVSQDPQGYKYQEVKHIRHLLCSYVPQSP